MADENDDGGEVAVEVAARQLGWVPQEQFRGAPEKWVDAETFVKKGKTVLPILQENNRRLEQTVAQMSGRMTQLQELILAGQESMEELKSFHESDIKRAVEQERTRLQAKLKDARENGTVEEEAEIFEEIANLRRTTQPDKETSKPNGHQPQQQTQQAPALDPAFIAWQKAPENDWFGSDRRKTALAVGIAEDLRSDPANAGLKGRAFYDRLTEEVEAYTNPQGRKADRVEGGRAPTNGGGNGKGGKSYAALPAEAKEVCDRQEKKLVGPGRAFKTQAEWRNHYATQYFRE